MKLRKLIAAALVLTAAAAADAAQPSRKPFNPIENRTRPHLDHRAFFSKSSFRTPQEVTRACLSCHENAAKQVMKTQHWTWFSGDVMRDGKLVRLGKRNLMNNFCISITGNWAACTRCHAGYGWTGETFDFTKEENVDCLICHDGSGSYAKGPGGIPLKSVNLKMVAGSVRTPTRENCGICHFDGGGGIGVKHGDLDDSLLNPNEDLDVHMGRLDFVCIDCHRTRDHLIAGKANTTYSSATTAVRFGCPTCHTDAPHGDADINRHARRVACETCHIPRFARKRPTKMVWDWSKAGDGARKEDTHEYMKIKGEFRYARNVVPEYAWYDGRMERYLTGDPIVKGGETAINRPIGSKAEARARIAPFKVHRAKQVFDPVNGILLPPVTAGEGGYWTTFDWDRAVRKGATLAGLPYSGEYAFTPTRMYWPIAHMVAPASEALTCDQCHAPEGRIDWRALGYPGDPTE